MAAISWNQFAVDNNLTSEQTQEGLDRLAIGYGPSMGVTYKVKPNVKVEGMAGYGPAVKGVAEINNDYFAVSDGYTAGFGAKASATVGIDLGPYAPGIFGDMSHTYSGSFGGVIGNVGGSVGKDGIGFSFAVGPGIGLSGSSTKAKDDKLKLNGDMTEDLYRHDFR